MSAGDTKDFKNLREMFGRFRILIVGRANAGKTTILRAICNSTEDPEIYDGKGNKDNPSQVEGSMGRGIHDVENEVIFRSNDKFIFHDSQGFEAGSEGKFLRMKKFITDRAKTTILKNAFTRYGIAFQWTNSTEQSNALRKSFLMNVIRER